MNHLPEDRATATQSKMRNDMFSMTTRLRNLFRKERAEFSISFSLAITMLVYLMLVLLSIVINLGQMDTAMPVWLWYVGVTYMMGSLILHVMSSRLLWFRAHDAFGATLFVILACLTPFYILRISPSDSAKYLSGGALVVLVFFVFFALYRYVQCQEKMQSAGVTGHLNEDTGYLYPGQTSETATEWIESKQLRERRVAAIGIPVAAGVTGLLLTITTSNQTIAFYGLVALAMVVLGELLLAQMVYRVVWIYRWEKQHKKHILLVS